MTRLTKLTFILFAVAFSYLLHAQANDTILIQRIISMAKTRGEASSILRILTDSIGGRVTGTAQCKKTSAFLLTKLKEFGFENAHLESYELKTSWTHNSAIGRIVNPTNQSVIS